ncbi:MAG: GNAT family N-acetyltransferase [Acidobacteriota bacterium]
MSDPIQLRTLSPSDSDWVNEWLRSDWGSSRIVTRGRLHDPMDFPGWVAHRASTPVGVLVYRPLGDAAELLWLQVHERRQGIGRQLVEALQSDGWTRRWSRIWAITTEDNRDALEFYRAMDFECVARHEGALDVARRLKPSIPEVGSHGKPLHDELELAVELTRRQDEPPAR